MGRGIGSNPKALVVADAAATLEFEYFRIGRTSEEDGSYQGGDRMRERQRVRGAKFRFGISVKITALICVVAAAVLTSGYGDGLSPSA